MPVALEGVELLAIALTFACLLLALAIQHGILRPLGAVLRHMPVAGGWLAGRVDDLGNAIVGYLQQALGYQMRLAVTLFHGTAAMLAEIVNAPLELAREAEAALHLLRHGVVPLLIKVLLAPVARVAHAAQQLAAEGWRYSHAQVARLDGKINHWASRFEHTVEAPWLYFQSHLWPRLLSRVDGLEGMVARTIPAELAAIRRRLGLAEHELGQVGGEIEQAVAHAVGSVPGDVLAAERAVAAELPELAGLDLPDVERLLKDLPWGTLAGLLAAVPLLRVLAQTIAAESGLDRAECRTKVRGICSTDPAAWFRLLEGLAALGIGFSLEELIELGIKGVGEAEAIIEHLRAA